MRGPDRRKITQEQTSLNLEGGGAMGGWRERGQGGRDKKVQEHGRRDGRREDRDRGAKYQEEWGALWKQRVEG